MNLKVLLISFLGLLIIPSAHAHKFSTAYLDVSEKAAQPNLIWKVSLHDLASADLLGLTSTQIGWQQIMDSHESIARYIEANIVFKSQDDNCALQLATSKDWQTQRIQQQTYLLLPIYATCISNEGWHLSYTALFETGHSHKLLLNWNTTSLKANTVLSENHITFPAL